MLLKQIRFYHFRNFEKEHFVVNPFLTIIIGENARGKTNLLEGIHVILQGEGFRESKEEELIEIDKNNTYVEGTFGKEEETFTYRVLIDKKKDFVEKYFFLNKTKKKHIQYLQEQIKAVLFTPEQIEIIIGSPGIRRGYFDKLISYYDYGYKKKLDNYENALRRRNKVLEKHFDENKLREELLFWNRYLVEQAEYITKKRQEYIDYLNQFQKLDAKEFCIEYVANTCTTTRLNEVFEEEKRWRRTLIGPQKDDFQIYLKENRQKNIHHYGSRSEQRMAVFWLKMNEIRYYEEARKKRPILLFDDIFSELDLHNKKIILDLIKKYQTIITTTEHEVIKLAKVSNTIIRL
ncbi:DNA replication/repair protein RecF [Candidatus Roizmanbacteria bacterium]|nr:DNA replication/repair protein RecF [Candidatus Roizmanbacteria bacterium]